MNQVTQDFRNDPALFRHDRMMFWDFEILNHLALQFWKDVIHKKRSKARCQRHPSNGEHASLWYLSRHLECHLGLSCAISMPKMRRGRLL